MPPILRAGVSHLPRQRELQPSKKIRYKIHYTLSSPTPTRIATERYLDFPSRAHSHLPRQRELQLEVERHKHLCVALISHANANCNFVSRFFISTPMHSHLPRQRELQRHCCNFLKDKASRGVFCEPPFFWEAAYPSADLSLSQRVCYQGAEDIANLPLWECPHSVCNSRKRESRRNDSYAISDGSAFAPPAVRPAVRTAFTGVALFIASGGSAKNAILYPRSGSVQVHRRHFFHFFHFPAWTHKFFWQTPRPN